MKISKKFEDIAFPLLLVGGMCASPFVIKGVVSAGWSACEAIVGKDKPPSSGGNPRYYKSPTP